MLLNLRSVNGQGPGPPRFRGWLQGCRQCCPRIPLRRLRGNCTRHAPRVRSFQRRLDETLRTRERPVIPPGLCRRGPSKERPCDVRRATGSVSVVDSRVIAPTACWSGFTADQRCAYWAEPKRTSRAFSSVTGLPKSARTRIPRCTAGRASITSSHRFRCG